MKYPINKEFSPYSHFTPPIKRARTAGWLGGLMKPPHRVWHDKEVRADKRLIKSYDGQEIEVIILEPICIDNKSACLIYLHGGGFFFGAAGYHYVLARQYALDTPCKVVFVQYRLSPKYSHPTQSEDCYAALEWTIKNADELNIDRNRIAVGGDSAGGALAAAVCQIARDRGTQIPLFQLLVYPVTDRRMNTRSQKTYTDTPMWNSGLSKVMWKGYVQGDEDNIAYASPMEADSFSNLPQAYVEVVQFDCLHDEGVAYANALSAAGVSVELHEVKGAMHGFDIKLKAPSSKAARERRIEYMRRVFDLN